MNITRRDFTFGTLVAAACTATGCQRSGSGRDTIAVLFDGLYSPFWVAGHDAIVDSLKARGFDVAEAMSAQDDEKQLSQVKTMLAKGVKGIIMVHTDSKAVHQAIREANRMGVPMVHFNRAPAESDYPSVAIQADNRRITNEAVQSMVDVAKERGGKYKAAVLIGKLGDQNAIARRDGFLDVVDQHKEMIEVVSRIPTDWNEDVAFKGLTNALSAHPDINFIFTSSDFLFPQIMQAMKSADKWYPIGDKRHVIFGGFDGDRTAYELIETKFLDADGVQELQLEAKLCVQAVVDLISGVLDLSQFDKFPHVIPDPGFAIHQGNVNDVRERMWGYQLWKQDQTESLAAKS